MKKDWAQIRYLVTEEVMFQANLINFKKAFTVHVCLDSNFTLNKLQMQC